MSTPQPQIPPDIAADIAHTPCLKDLYDALYREYTTHFHKTPADAREIIEIVWPFLMGLLGIDRHADTRSTP